MHKLPLKDVCKIQYGYPFDSKLFNANNIGKPLVRIRDVVRGYTETYTSETCADGYVVTRGDILIGMDGEFNIAKWRSDSAFLNQRVCKITPQGDIDEDYLLYYLLQALKAVEDKTSYVTVKHLSAKVLESIEIPLIGLQEQKEITTKLNRLSSLIDKRKQQLENLDKLIKSQFIEMFGDPIENTKSWPTETVERVCERIFGGGTPSKSCSEYYAGQIPWVTPKDMKTTLIYDSIDHITEDAVKNSTTNAVPVGAVLMVIRSGILKHTLPVALSGAVVTINQDMKAFVVRKEIINASYLLHFFQAIEKDVLSEVRGVTADNIDFKAFVKRKVVLPPIEQQNEFARFVEQTDKSKFTIKQSLEQLEILKKSLMQKYFG